MLKKFTILAGILLLLLSCTNSQEESFLDVPDNIAFIKVEENEKAILITNKSSITSLANMFKEAKLLNNNFASYPSALPIKITIITENEEEFLLLTSTPNYANIPTTIKYGDILFIAPNYPHIPELKIYLKRTKPDRLLPK